MKNNIKNFYIFLIATYDIAKEEADSAELHGAYNISARDNVHE